MRRGKPVALIRAGVGPAGRRRPRIRGAAGRHRRLGRRLHHHAGRRNRGRMRLIFLERQAHRRALLRGVVPRCAGPGRGTGCPRGFDPPHAGVRVRGERHREHPRGDIRDRGRRRGPSLSQADGSRRGRASRIPGARGQGPLPPVGRNDGRAAVWNSGGSLAAMGSHRPRPGPWGTGAHADDAAGVPEPGDRRRAGRPGGAIRQGRRGHCAQAPGGPARAVAGYPAALLPHGSGGPAVRAGEGDAHGGAVRADTDPARGVSRPVVTLTPALSRRGRGGSCAPA